MHEHFGGVVASRSPLRERGVDARHGEPSPAAGRLRGRPVDYGRVDMMRLADGRLVVSELELIEPGLYLDVLPANADAVRRRWCVAPDPLVAARSTSCRAGAGRLHSLGPSAKHEAGTLVMRVTTPDR